MEKLKIANELMDEMEKLLSKANGLSYEDDDKLQELYYKVEEKLEYGSDMTYGHNSSEKGIDSLSNSKSRFKKICAQFETPDDINDSTMNDMFPDEDSMEGFW